MIKKAKIDNSILDITDLDTLLKNPECISSGDTAIVENGIIYPIRNKTDSRPGIYVGNTLVFYKDPNIKEDPQYSENNIIDFTNTTKIKDVIEKQNKLKSMERTILTDKNSIVNYPIKETDCPEMKLLKEAVNAKCIDIEKYAQRFSNFNNDRRLFNENSISMKKLKSICEALDINCTLTLEDKEDNVPNPIGRKITVSLLGGVSDEAE